MSRYRKWLAATCVLVFYTNVLPYFAKVGLLPVGQAPFVVAVALFTIPVLNRATVVKVGSSGLFLWCLLYLLINVLWFAFGPQTQIEWQYVLARSVDLGFLITMLTVLADPGARNEARRFIAIAVLIACIVHFYEVLFPGTFSVVMGRANGLYLNSNRAGSAIMMGLVFGYDAIPARLRSLALVVFGLGVLATFSRSSSMVYVGIVFLMHIEDLRRLKSLALAVALGGALVVLLLVWGSVVSDQLTQVGTLNENTMHRLTMAIDSGDTRLHVARRALERYYDAPLLGWGTGSSFEPPFDEVGPHNQYLAFMVEFGILGAFLLPLAVFLTVKRPNGWGECALPFAFAMLARGFASHNLFDNRDGLIIFALAAMIPPKAKAPVEPPVVAGRSRLAETRGQLQGKSSL